VKHFIKETDFSVAELPEVFALARDFKRLRNRHTPPTLKNQTWAMFFFKNSTRTRISFDVGIYELGGNSLYLTQESSQISRGESWSDTAKVMSRYVHGAIIRAYEHKVVEEFAAAGDIPVINALTDFLHPCQSYSDVFTMAEKWSSNDDLINAVKGRKVTFVGDCNSNMAKSLVLAGSVFNFEVALSGPPEFAPKEDLRNLLNENGLQATYVFDNDPMDTVVGSDVVYTDVWVSMGNEQETEERIAILNPYSVTPKLMAQAKPNALFMHCLPAHPGQEVAKEVIEGQQSIIYDQAENRLHMQKAILSVLSEANSNRPIQ
tara:strand:- start:4041 stop:4997 length:957 start_codon:yes stop_codon:yes gene_type:complete